MARDYYQILGVTKSASSQQMKKAYRKLAMQHHPDRNPGNEKGANAKFKEINEAFGVLGDPQKRRQYDQFGTTGNIGDVFGSRFTRTTFEDLMRDFGGSGLGFGFLDDIFGDLLKGRGFSFRTFRRGGRSREGIRSQTRRGNDLGEIFSRGQHRQNHDIRYEIVISKEQAAQGLEKDLVRKGKKLRVKIPGGVGTGSKVKLRSAREITDGQPGDIVILVKVK